MFRAPPLIYSLATVTDADIRRSVTSPGLIELSSLMVSTSAKTKKALKNIRARERNQVDVSAMEGVAGHIQASIEANSRGLPTTGE